MCRQKSQNHLHKTFSIWMSRFCIWASSAS
uniref:Uncharacterized protein n=1 Tax=Geladintestivirus 1 TaxID=3233133 RepID=A0AAU8MI93_9CAUD